MNFRKLLLPLIALSAFTAQAGDKIKVYFNHPVDTAVSTGVKAINLNGAIDDTLVAYINRAKYTMDVAVYNFTSVTSASLANVATAINNAYSRGVKVRWIYNEGSTNSGMSLLNSGIPILGRPINSSNALMHDKFLIIDGKSTNPTDAIVWTGSTNWSVDQFDLDYDNIVILQDSALALAYIAEFNQMWGDTGMTPNSSASKFGSTKSDLGRHNFVIEGKTVNLFFSPSDNTNAQIVTAINSADKDLYFAMFAFTYNTNANSIVTRYNNGVYVSGIVDTFSATTSSSTYPILLSGLSRAHYKVYSGAGLYHNKYMIADPSDPCSDPLVLTGSHNWSNAANTINDENTLIIHDDTVANLFYQSFRGDFYALGGTMSTISGCNLSTSHTKSDLEFAVYPNPANGYFNVNLALKVAQQVNIELVSVDGKMVQSLMREWMQPGEVSHGFQLPSKGMFFLRVISANEIQTRLIVSE